MFSVHHLTVHVNAQPWEGEVHHSGLGVSKLFITRDPQIKREEGLQAPDWGESPLPFVALHE